MHRKIPKDKMFRKLRPVFDTTNEIIRCKGRAQALLARYNLDALILFPPDHYVTTVLLRKFHRRVGHMGLNAHGHTRSMRELSESQLDGFQWDPRELTYPTAKDRGSILGHRYRPGRPIQRIGKWPVIRDRPKPGEPEPESEENESSDESDEETPENGDTPAQKTKKKAKNRPKFAIDGWRIVKLYSMLHRKSGSDFSVQNHLVAGQTNWSLCFWKKAAGWRNWFTFRSKNWE